MSYNQGATPKHAVDDIRSSRKMKKIGAGRECAKCIHRGRVDESGNVLREKWNIVKGASFYCLKYRTTKWHYPCYGYKPYGGV